MKLKLIGIVLMAMMAASCGNTVKDDKAALNDKKAELQKLKNEQKELTDKIAKLETDIRKADPTGVAAAAKLVGVTPLGTGDFAHYIELQGRVDAQNISYVAPPNGAGGIVKALYVTQGQSVSKGQVLARLDDALIRQQIDPLKAQLDAARDTYRRVQNLWDQGIGTYQQVLTAKTQVETLERQIGIINKQASLMTITAPQSGVADQVNVRVGEMFVGATAAGPQIRIVNTGNLKIIAAVPENYLGRVSVGSKLRVVLPEQNNREMDAVVNVVQKVIDPNTRSFNIEARIPSEANLKPNQIAKVKILDYASNDVITIPVNVIQSDEKGKYVYVMETAAGKSVARKKYVITGETYTDKVELKSGLANGDQLITQGYQDIYEGQVIATSNQ
jgi:RND family efflux transporter MFP subunit